MELPRLTLGVIIAGLVPALLFARVVVRRSEGDREALAQEWSDRGLADLPHSPIAAATDFETALSYGPARTPDQLRLAEAFIAARRPAEARSELLTLWAEQPGSGPINLDLARLAAADRDVSSAVRYYHAAVDGAWESGAASARRGARLELARMLLANGQPLLAQAELIALIDDLPLDAQLMTDVGGLLVDAGADNRAIALLQSALQLDPSNTSAARLAGAIEFRAGQYELSHKYLTAAASRSSLDAGSQAMLDVSARVLALDPYVAGIGARERMRRSLASLGIGRARLQTCSAGHELEVAPNQAPTDLASERAPTDLASAPPVADLTSRVNAATRMRPLEIEHDADLTDQIMALVFDIEMLPTTACGPGTLDDRALQLLADRRGAHAR